MDVEGREVLRGGYAELVDDELPAAAWREGWSIRLDLCFGRVLLDDAGCGCWYDVLGRGRGAAYRRLDEQPLAWRIKPSTQGRTGAEAGWAT